MKVNLKKILGLYNKVKNDEEFIKESEAANKLKPDSITDYSEGSPAGAGETGLGKK